MLSTGAEDLHGGPRTLALRVVGGALPEGLGGHLFVSGSIATPGRPAYAGEGMLYRVDFDEAVARLTRAVLRPPCFYVDHALRGGRHGALLRFHDLGLTRVSPRLGVRTVLGTSPVFLRDRMIVTTDVGRPWQVDPVSLEVVTPIGRDDEWRAAVPAPWLFPLVLGSAHPAVDADTNELFTVNWSPPGIAGAFCRLVRWRGGELEHFEMVDQHGTPVRIHRCAHQLGLGRHHVVIQDASFNVEMRQFVYDAVDLVVPGAPMRRLFGGPTRAHDPSTVFFVIPRAALAGRGGTVRAPVVVRVVRVELPGESVHFSVQDDDADTLTLLVPHTPTLDVSRWIREGERMLDGSRARVLADLPVPCALTPGTVGVHAIDVRTGGVTTTRRICGEATWGLGLATHAPATGRPIEVVFHNTAGFFPELIPEGVARAYAGRVDAAALPIAAGRLPRLIAVELATGEVTSWTCPNGWLMLSPCFVPRVDRPGGRAGFVVCVVHAAPGVPRGMRGQELWIFDAGDVSRGPVCRLGHGDLDFAFTIHAAWTPTLRPSPRDDAVVVADELRRGRGRGAVARLVDEHVLPRFER